MLASVAGTADFSLASLCFFAFFPATSSLTASFSAADSVRCSAGVGPAVLFSLSPARFFSPAVPADLPAVAAVWPRTGASAYSMMTQIIQQLPSGAFCLQTQNPSERSHQPTSCPPPQHLPVPFPEDAELPSRPRSHPLPSPRASSPRSPWPCSACRASSRPLSRLQPAAGPQARKISSAQTSPWRQWWQQHLLSAS